MSVHCSRLSLPEQRWTLATWATFVGLFAFLPAGGSLPMGLGVVDMVVACFRGMIEVPAEVRRPGSGLSAAFVCLCLGVFLFVLPIAIALVPTLATLLYLMKRSHRSTKGRDDAESGDYTTPKTHSACNIEGPFRQEASVPLFRSKKYRRVCRQDVRRA